MIYFKLAFNQAFLASSGTLVTSAKSLGSVIKFETSEPDSPNIILLCASMHGSERLHVSYLAQYVNYYLLMDGLSISNMYVSGNFDKTILN